LIPEIPRRNVAEDDSASAVQERLHKNTKLWSFYIDLEESLGTLESTKAAYESVLDLRIATPQLVLNYAALLAENKYFEDSFRVYERGVALFSYPTVMPLWVTYLTKFVERFQGTKLERARDLFEQALEKAPPVHHFFCLYIF
jgi:pre-mRNA-splicing factor SYF1